MEEEIFKKIDDLGFEKSSFIVLGSGILQALGIRYAKDLDILVSEEFFNTFENKQGWEFVSKTGKKGDVIDLYVKDDIQVYKNVYGEFAMNYFLEDLKRFVKIKDVLFSSLDDLLRMKTLWSREKDQRDIELIKDFLSKQEM